MVDFLILVSNLVDNFKAKNAVPVFVPSLPSKRAIRGFHSMIYHSNLVRGMGIINTFCCISIVFNSELSLHSLKLAHVQRT